MMMLMKLQWNLKFKKMWNLTKDSEEEQDVEIDNEADNEGVQEQDVETDNEEENEDDAGPDQCVPDMLYDSDSNEDVEDVGGVVTQNKERLESNSSFGAEVGHESEKELPTNSDENDEHMLDYTSDDYCKSNNDSDEDLPNDPLKGWSAVEEARAPLNHAEKFKLQKGMFHFRKNIFLKCYRNKVHGIRDPTLPDIEPAKIKPPTLKGLSRRPNKHRRRELGEQPKSIPFRRTPKIKCGLCGSTRHNKRTCQKNPNPGSSSCQKRGSQIVDDTNETGT